MAIEWKDVTSYSRNDTERTPRSFQATVAGIRLEVTKHINYPDGEWVLSASGLIANRLMPATVSAERAQDALVTLITKRLEEVLAALRS